MSSSKPNDMKSVRKAKHIDDIDFDKLELLRGETPADITEKCLRLCKDYLADNWTEQTVSSIVVRRVAGGLKNQIYYCGIKEKSVTSDAPQEVAIRLYGPNSDNGRLAEVVIGLMTSENGLGPKIYGIFQEGQIQHYYEHREFNVEEQKDPELVEEVFKKLAMLHSMDVPVVKDGQWLFGQLYQRINQVETHLDRGMKEILEQGKIDILLKYNLREEFEWLKRAINKSGTPIVFCHNDFRRSNILVLEDEQDIQNQNGRIVVCDFETSRYGFRGRDFGGIINVWGRTWNDRFKTEHVFPDDHTIRRLIDIYREESERLFGQKWSQLAVNSVDQLLKEFKLFSLVGTLFITLFFLRDWDIDDTFPMDKPLSAKFAEICYKNFRKLKTQFIKEGTLEE